MELNINLQQLKNSIQTWGKDLGFQQVAITDTDLEEHEAHLLKWLEKGYHGTMEYMAKYGNKRARPTEIVPGTLRIIMVRMNYLPPTIDMLKVLKEPQIAAISRYALGKDYHKLIRKRLQKLAEKINTQVNDLRYRAFVDSGPVLEKALGEKSGLGWIGKHTILLNREAGSWFFLGCLFTNIPLPVDSPISKHCGTCNNCIDICPTGAIIKPYQLDARRCISYLTIEYKGSIPLELRPLIGNRIYGCDDCQLACPWNRFAKLTQETHFHPRHGLENPKLIDLFNLSEPEFLALTEGSAIRRAGYISWIRNIAIALGNAPYEKEIVAALKAKQHHPIELIREHVTWALEQQLKSMAVKELPS